MFNKKNLFASIAVVFLGLLSLTAAMAQTAPDPVIRTGGGGGSVAITSPDFTIVSTTGNSPTDSTPCLVIQHGVTTSAPGCFFINKIVTEGGGGATIKGVIFVVNKDAVSGPLSCALNTALGGVSPWFSKCTVAPDGIPAVIFSGGSGIPYGGDFSFGFRGFLANATFRVFSAGEF